MLFRSQIASNIVGTGQLTKQGGASTTILQGSNTFVGPILVNSSGTLQFANPFAAFTNSITVSNGKMIHNTGTITTLNVYGGTVEWNAAGTLTTANVYGGTLDATDDTGGPRTITTANVHSGRLLERRFGTMMSKTQRSTMFSQNCAVQFEKHCLKPNSMRKDTERASHFPVESARMSNCLTGLEVKQGAWIPKERGRNFARRPKTSVGCRLRGLDMNGRMLKV